MEKYRYERAERQFDVADDEDEYSGTTDPLYVEGFDIIDGKRGHNDPVAFTVSVDDAERVCRALNDAG